MQSLHSKLDALLLLKTEFSKLATTVNDVEKSVYFLAKKYDTVLSELKSTQEKVATQEVEMQALKRTLQVQSKQLEQLLHEQNEAEQYSRKGNMEIHGFPMAVNENLSEWIVQLAEMLKVPKFSAGDIVAIHRLPAKQGFIPAVLVRFASVAIKETWFGLRGKLRQLYESDALPRLFFNENLTRTNRRLFSLARVAAKANNYKFVWVKGGKIFVKKFEDAPLIRVNSEADIGKIRRFESAPPISVNGEVDA